MILLQQINKLADRSFVVWGFDMAATNHDDQRNNLVKFVIRCQMSLTVVTRRLYIWREIA